MPTMRIFLIISLTLAFVLPIFSAPALPLARKHNLFHIAKAWKEEGSKICCR